MEQQGFDIVHSSNGVEGWDMFKSFDPDICIVDIMMPRKNGLLLVKDIRSVNQHVPVIFLTAKSQTDDVIAGFKPVLMIISKNPSAWKSYYCG